MLYTDELKMEDVGEIIHKHLKRFYGGELRDLWKECFQLLGIMCEASEVIQTEIAKSMLNTYNSTGNDFLMRHLEQRAPIVSSFIAKLVTGNAYICSKVTSTNILTTLLATVKQVVTRCQCCRSVRI